MTRSTRLRRIFWFTAAAALCAALAASASLVLPAGAFDKGTISTKGEGKQVKKSKVVKTGGNPPQEITLTKFDDPPDGRPARSLPASAARTVEPDECDVADFCDHWRLKVPVPDGLLSGDDYDLKVLLEWCDTSALDLALYDNKQVKLDNAELRKKPGDDQYQPSDTTSDYTRVAFKGQGTLKEKCQNPARPNDPPTTFTRKENVITLATPDLPYREANVAGQDPHNYNLTVLLFSGTNTSGYWLSAWVEVKPYQEPGEVLEPDAEPTSQSAPIEILPEDDFAAFDPGSSLFTDPDLSLSLNRRRPRIRDLFDQYGALDADDTGESVVLGEVETDVDPLLESIKGSNLEDELAAPTLEAAGLLEEELPPPPPAAVVAVSLLVLPVAGAIGSAIFAVRRRSAFRLV